MSFEKETRSTATDATDAAWSVHLSLCVGQTGESRRTGSTDPHAV